MGLETPTYISDLIASNPVGIEDDVTDGKFHIQRLKSALKATFTTASAAANPTHTEFNVMQGASAGSTFAAGVTSIFSMAAAPTGWAFATVLQDSLIKLSGSGGGTGGAWSLASNLPAHALTVSESPPHSHTVTATANHNHTLRRYTTGTGSGLNVLLKVTGADVAAAVSQVTDTLAGHTHALSSIGNPVSSTEGEGHQHTFDLDGTWRPKYKNVIICAKT